MREVVCDSLHASMSFTALQMASLRRVSQRVCVLRAFVNMMSVMFGGGGGRSVDSTQQMQMVWKGVMWSLSCSSSAASQKSCSQEVTSKMLVTVFSSLPLRSQNVIGKSASGEISWAFLKPS